MANRGLKIEHSMPTPDRNRILETFLDEKTPMGTKGHNRNRALNDPVRARINQAIDGLPDSPGSNTPVESVLRQSSKLWDDAKKSPQDRKRIQNQVEGLESELIDNYYEQGITDLSPRQLEELRRSQSAGANYDTIGLDPIAAQQNATRNQYLKGSAADARAELVRQAPELDALYAQQGPRIEMNKYLDKAETAIPETPVLSSNLGGPAVGLGGLTMLTGGNLPLALGVGGGGMLIGTLFSNPRFAPMMAKILSTKTGMTAKAARKFLVENKSLTVAEAIAMAEQRAEDNQNAP
jgi:hypothetical protein